MSSSEAPINANDGHAAMTRPYAVGSAAATFATRLAALPAASSVHGSTPPERPARESASNVIDEATIMPSTDNGISALGLHKISRTAEPVHRPTARGSTGSGTGLVAGSVFSRSAMLS